MAAQAFAHTRFGVRASHAGIEDAVRLALGGARPSLDEILSLWPVARHDRIVLWARVSTDGAISLGARLREQAFEGQSPALARDVRRIRNDVPVVLELDNVGSVVVPMRELKARR
jgi:hypothetical protein